MSDARREENIRIVRAYMDALNGWDIERMAQMSTDDVVFEIPFRPPTFARTTDGKSAYMEVLAQARDHMIDGSENLHDATVDTLGSDPNELVATYKSNMPLRSGVTHRNGYISRFTIRDGLVARFVEYYDSIILFEALGGTLEWPQTNDLVPEGLHSSNA